MVAFLTQFGILLNLQDIELLSVPLSLLSSLRSYIQTNIMLCRSCGALQGKHVVFKLVPAITILLFAVWGLGPVMRLSRNIFLHVCALFCFLFFFGRILFVIIYLISDIPLGHYILHFIIMQKSDKSWNKSGTNYVVTSYLQPILLWTGATLICRY